MTGDVVPRQQGGVALFGDPLHLLGFPRPRFEFLEVNVGADRLLELSLDLRVVLEPALQRRIGLSLEDRVGVPIIPGVSCPGSARSMDGSTAIGAPPQGCT